MSEEFQFDGYGSAGGRFATARRGGIDSHDIAFIEQKSKAGVSASNIARMIGRTVSDVQPHMLEPEGWPANAALTKPPQPAPEPPRVMLSLWKGLIDRHETSGVTTGRGTSAQREIAERVAAASGITVTDLKSPMRGRRYAWPRQASMWLMKQAGKWSLPQIGAYHGGRDHTTVIHACERVEQRLDECLASAGFRR